MRILRYIAPIALLAIISCSKDMTDEHCNNDITILSVSMPETLVKTALGEKYNGVYPVIWSEGDKLIVNGVESMPLDALEAGKPTARFTFEASLQSPYNVTYCGCSGRDDIVEIPTLQNLESNKSFGKFIEPMWAVSSSLENIRLRHVGAVLMIPLLGDTDSRVISHVSISSTGGEPLAGLIKISKEDGAINGKFTPVGRANTLNVVPDAGMCLSTSAVNYIVAVVAPGQYNKGIDAAVVASDGSVMHLHSFANESLDAGRVYEFEEIVFTSEEKYDYTISSSAELTEFRSKVNAGETDLSAVLLDDIDASGIWTTPLDGFTGMLNGGGHSVYGLTCPMFNELKGIVRNLVVEAEINGNLPYNDKAWIGILAQRIAGDGGQNPYTGFVINCTTKGSLYVNNTSTTAGNANVGGIVGYMVKGRLINCINEASISAGAGNGTKRLNVGGIAGRLYTSGNEIIVNGCVNKGNITISGTPTVYNAGGVIGESNTVSGTSVPNTIDSCVNLGEILVTATPTSTGSAKNDIAGNSTNDIVNCL